MSIFMQRQNYRTLSLISHPSTMMLRVILNRLETKAEELWLAHSRTDLQQTNPPVVWSVKEFDRVWYAGLLRVSRSFNIEEGLVQVIQALYKKS